MNPSRIVCLQGCGGGHEGGVVVGYERRRHGVTQRGTLGVCLWFRICGSHMGLLLLCICFRSKYLVSLVNTVQQFCHPGWNTPFSGTKKQVCGNVHQIMHQAPTLKQNVSPFLAVFCHILGGIYSVLCMSP